ncbi:hypothetical protein DOTSEDRAFT_29644 [Dothistroma septosporum NZE10]|uniref:Uncharacterized protein n=1 Tax=Dothistroma septosporum (strain NZE10 / CBS 128990) TaxID=675120 RepID=M2YHP1_DOTSN|nr:hypothetical protein DOTSEDRAFT_29644 [Dothistroma septosporum NZE10]
MHILDIPLIISLAFLTLSIAPVDGKDHLLKAIITGCKGRNCEIPERWLQTERIDGDSRCQTFMGPWKSLLGAVNLANHPEKNPSFGNCTLYIWGEKHCKGEQLWQVNDVIHLKKGESCWYSETSGLNTLEQYKGPVRSARIVCRPW